MSTQKQGPTLTRKLAVAVTLLFACMKVSTDGEVVVTTGVASEDGNTLGPLQRLGSADDFRAIRHHPSVISSTFIASKAIAVNDRVYTAAAGKVTDAATSKTFLGVAGTVATADGDEIEVIRTMGGEDDIT